MDYSLSWQGNVLISKLSGELGFKDQIAMTRALDEMAKTSPAGIVLDFREVVYLASMGIGMLIKLVKDFRDKGINVRLAAPRPGVKMLLEMVRAESVIPIDPSIEESVQRLPVPA
jgi:anti-anti-sigma factor